MYKPAQFWWLVALFSFAEGAGQGSWQVLRVCHLATIPAIGLLLVAHVGLSWRMGGLRLLRGMFL
jgi:thiosulfate reductase cytochrome b subunit